MTAGRVLFTQLCYSWVVTARGGISAQALDVALSQPTLVAMIRNMKSIKASILALSLALVTYNVALAATDTYSRKMDELNGTNWEDAMARLDNFAIALSNEPGSVGVLIVYGGRRGKRGEAQAWGKCLNDYMVNRRGINADRIVLVDGSYRDSMTVEIWQSVSKPES